MSKRVTTLITLLLLAACNGDDNPVPTGLDFKQEMRKFVTGISQYAKSETPGFIIIPQNGIELVSDNGDENGQPETDYLNAIDGNGQEDLYYGYKRDDFSTPDDANNYLRVFLDISKNAGNKILVTDYCSTHSKMDDSYLQNKRKGYVSFAADHRDLDNIPSYPTPVYSENDNQISSISEIKNFLYLIDPETFSSKKDFINAITATNYDLLIMDLFFKEGTAFTTDEIQLLRSKANGGSRLVVAYMSIGEAEDYRYYWQSDWKDNKPNWLDDENPNWAGNFKVRYWDKEWQNIIYGNDNSYLKKILNAGFDGVYLDIIDAYEYFE